MCPIGKFLSFYTKNGLSLRGRARGFGFWGDYGITPFQKYPCGEATFIATKMESPLGQTEIKITIEASRRGQYFEKKSLIFLSAD